MEFDIHSTDCRAVVCVDNSQSVWGCGENSHLLEVGKEYTVEDVDVHGWHTEVYLKEIPGKPFNSVLFEEKDGDPNV